MSGCHFSSLKLFCLLLSLVPLNGMAAPPESAVSKDEDQFRQLDISEDGVLSGREAKDFLKYDADGDKRVTLAEFHVGRATERGGAKPKAEAEPTFKELDTNADGVLSGKERRGYLEFDTNGDGEISIAEFAIGRAERQRAAARLQFRPPMATDATGQQTYHNVKEKLSPRHVKNFVPFRFTFPAGWKYDPKAGTEATDNIVKVERAIVTEKDGSYTQENFAIGVFNAPGNGEMVKALTQLLCDQLQRQIKLGFSKVQMNKTKDLKFGNYPSYGFDFSFKLPHPSKGEIDGWGRVYLISGETLKQPHGLSIIMLATSEAPELKGLDDLGVKGELPVIVKSFGVEEVPAKPEDDGPPPPPKP